MSKKNEIIQLTRMTFESSSIHAIPNIIRNKYILIKIIWLICFIVSFSGCTWFMIKSINDYLKYDVVTRIRVKYVNEIKFPVIGICNLKILNKKLDNELMMIKRYPYKLNKLKLMQIRSYATSLYYENKSATYFDPDDFIIDCYFGYVNCDKTNDFQIYYDFKYGICLKFNSGKNLYNQIVEKKTIYSTSGSNGLELELFIGDVDKNDNIFSREHGFNIIVHSQSELDSYNLNGIQIAPGTSTRIILSKISWKKEPKPYSVCTADLTSKDSYNSKTYKETFISGIQYSYNDCKNTCEANFIKNKCNCSLIISKNTTRICYLDDQLFQSDFECINSAFKQFSIDSLNINNCDCPIECKRTFYTYSSSYSLFPTRKYSEYILETDSFKSKYPNITTYEELKKNIARVEIFFDDMTETVIEESVKTEMSDLISNLGGILGLFLGLSFLSLIEFVEVFLQAIFVYLNNIDREIRKS